MPSVSSRAIRRIGYSPARQELSVSFRGSGTYVYEGVPRSVYEAFLAAPSKGNFFNQNVRERYRRGRSPRSM